MTGDGFNYRELKEIADEVRDELLLIDDAAKVEIVGAQEERVFVVFENARLAELGMSPLQLQAALQERNIVLPGGDVTSDYEKIVLEPTGNFESLEELRRSIVSLPMSNAMVRLEDILTIERGYVDPPESMVRFNGEPALMLAASRCATAAISCVSAKASRMSCAACAARIPGRRRLRTAEFPAAGRRRTKINDVRAQPRCRRSRSSRRSCWRSWGCGPG